MWKNSEPHLWSRDKWEVAKVYLPHGHKNHKSIGDFDIAALLCLMTQCKHFKKFELSRLCEKVCCVRNNIMHSANYQLKQEDLHNYMGRVRDLGEVLAKHHPDFRNLSKDIDEIQNLDFRLILPAQHIQAQHEKELEDKLFAALEVISEKQSKVEMLEQILFERDKEIETLHLSYGEKLKTQQIKIDQRDRIIEAMNSAVEQEATVMKIGMTLRQVAESLQQCWAVEQEARESIWMKLVKPLSFQVDPIECSAVKLETNDTGED